jgi:transcriptional regulator
VGKYSVNISALEAVLLGTIPQARTPILFVEQIRAAANVHVITLTRAYRDAETARVYQCLQDFVQGLS